MVFIDVSCFSFIWVSVPGFGAVSLDGFAGVPLVWVMIFIVSHGFPRCYMRFLCLGICRWLWCFRMVFIDVTCVSLAWVYVPGFGMGSPLNLAWT